MPFKLLNRLSHTQAVFLMVAVTLMWSIAGVVSRQLESAARFEVTFWRSAFTFVSTEPPMLGFNCGRRLGERKDTARNIQRMREYVVNIGDEGMLEAIHASSDELPPNVSEAAQLGLQTAPALVIATPRLAAAPASMECRLERVLQFGISGAEFFVGEVVNFHVRDDLYRDGKVDTEKLRPAARVGGPVYARLGEFVRFAPIVLSSRHAPGG